MRCKYPNHLIRRIHLIESRYSCAVNLKSSVHNWLIACAAAKIPCQGLLNILPVDNMLALKQLVHGHNKAWSTKTTLSTMDFDHLLLNRIELPVNSQSLNSHHVGTIQ